MITSIKNEGTGKKFDFKLIDKIYNSINVPLIVNGEQEIPIIFWKF